MYGLIEGVFRELGARILLGVGKPLVKDGAGNLDGTVPALALRCEPIAAWAMFAAAARPCDASKSGKLSLLGDSGIVSRNGVE